MKSFASITTLDHLSGYLSQPWDPIIFPNGCHCKAYSPIQSAKVSIHYQSFTEQCRWRQINWVFSLNPTMTNIHSIFILLQAQLLLIILKLLSALMSKLNSLYPEKYCLAVDLLCSQRTIYEFSFLGPTVPDKSHYPCCDSHCFSELEFLQTFI